MMRTSSSLDEAGLGWVRQCVGSVVVHIGVMDGPNNLAVACARRAGVLGCAGLSDKNIDPACV